MPRFLIRVQYDGANYFGWQRQIDGQVTIQSQLEDALLDLFGDEIKILGAGRTDRGVSARGMPAHFDAETKLRGEELRRAIDYRLPEDIAIRSLDEVGERFHCRYDAKGKVYAYRLMRARRRRPLTRHAHFWPREINFSILEEASKHLVGRHDFSSFATLLVKHPNRLTTQPDPLKPNKPEGNIRTIFDITTIRRGEMITLLLFGDGFLRGMVRAVVGTLLELATKDQDPELAARILEAKDRRDAGANMPAHALTLERVFYSDAEREAWIAQAHLAAKRSNEAVGRDWPEELF